MPDPIDPYKILQVDSEAEDEVIQAAYRRLARKYHPDLAATPEAAARMSAINAAWELIGDPAARAAFDREPCGEARRPPRRRRSSPGVRGEGGPGPGQPRPSSSGSGRSDAATTPSGGAAPGARDRLAGLDVRALEPGRRLRRVDAHGPGARCRRSAARAAVRDRPQLRALRGLVARRDRSARPRVHRVARPRCRSAGNYREEIDEILRTSGRRRVRDERGVRPARACTAGGSRARAGRSGVRRRLPSPCGPVPTSGRITRSISRPTVVPWTSSVNRTTPKVISWSRSRCGRSTGSERAIATATAPRRPPRRGRGASPSATRSASPGRAREARRAAEQDVDDHAPGR